MIDELIKKIQENRNDYEEDAQKEFDKWIKDLNESTALSQLADHFAIKDYIKLLQDRVVEINEQLLNTRIMTEIERKVLFERRDLCEEFINMFNVKQKIDEITKRINNL